jgi:hypothetical protein
MNGSFNDVRGRPRLGRWTMSFALPLVVLPLEDLRNHRVRFVDWVKRVTSHGR